jgi:arsenical pump membrane protein
MAGIAYAAGQTWPAFVLVTGLLLVGVVAEEDGLFSAAGAALARAPFGTIPSYVLSLGLVALVTATLNLDTSVVFLTPVLLHLARARRLDETPFLYGSVFMANASSLFLPGSNLTNLIALHGDQVTGAEFLSRMWAAALAAAVITAAALIVVFRDAFAAGTPEREPVRARVGAGALAIVVSAALVLVLQAPAVPVLLVGVAAVGVARPRRARLAAAIDARVLGGLFLVAVLLGAVGRWWTGPASLVGSLGRVGAAAGGAVAAVCLNNLPAAVLLTAHPPEHPRALLLGLNLGPNLAVTGSLSAFLWLRIARGLGAEPSVCTYSRIGAVLVPLSVAAALGALWLAAPGRL